MIKKIRILGGMTGTSCDALDVACVEFPSHQVLWTMSFPFPPELKNKILKVQDHHFKSNLEYFALLERDLTNWYSQCYLNALKNRPSKHVPHAISNHGQTILHNPSNQITIQFGLPFKIAAATNITTIAYHRYGDVAIGGQGAPLVPLYQKKLAEKANIQSICFHNIGGISNLTFIQNGNLTAFDTGLGNLWLDDLMRLTTKGKQHYDKGGRLARKGNVIHPLLNKLLHQPYFQESPPKSIGRENWPIELLLKLTRSKTFAQLFVTYPINNLLCTVTEFVAITLSDSYKNFVLPEFSQRMLKSKNKIRIVFFGGGSKNTFLMERISFYLEKLNFEVVVSEEPEFFEAQAFAYLGYASLMGQSLGGEWTQKQTKNTFGPPGAIIPGKNWNQIRKILGN